MSPLFRGVLQIWRSQICYKTIAVSFCNQLVCSRLLCHRVTAGFFKHAHLQFVSHTKVSGGLGGGAADGCCAQCVVTHWSMLMSDVNVGSAGCCCELCRHKTRLYICDHDGQNCLVCMTCRRDLEEGKPWVLPKDSADQPPDFKFGRPHTVSRSVLCDLTSSPRVNCYANPAGGHAPASSPACQTPANRPGDYLDTRNRQRGHPRTGLGTQDAPAQSTPLPVFTPAAHASAVRGSSGATCSSSSGSSRRTTSSVTCGSDVIPLRGIATLQNQVSLQHQLLVMQATLARQDEMLTSALGALGAPSHASTTMPQGVGMPLASPLLMGIGSAKKKYFSFGTFRCFARDGTRISNPSPPPPPPPLRETSRGLCELVCPSLVPKVPMTKRNPNHLSTRYDGA